MKLKATEVFIPNGFPTHSYIARAKDDLEGPLGRALATANSVVSLSGPSKSGKSVLVEKVVGGDNLIAVSGAQIGDAGELWERVLDWMDVPDSITSQSAKSVEHQVSASVSGKASVPLVLQAGGQGGYQRSAGNVTGTTATTGRGGFSQVEKEIAKSEYVVFVDDFHYMARPVQEQLARQIKAAAERGIRICVASVPHRSDDVVRSNPELQGRTTHINTTFWTSEELKQIAKVGFDALNMECSDEDALKIAYQACGSPQLMQRICLEVALELGVSETADTRQRLTINDRTVRQVLSTAARQLDFGRLVRQMHQGPKVRGMERKTHQFTDGSKGDVYRSVLLALASDPPEMSIPYGNLITRVAAICAGEEPKSSSITQACFQMHKFALGLHPEQRIIEWDETMERETLSIVNPYLLFYLRASDDLDDLARGS